MGRNKLFTRNNELCEQESYLNPIAVVGARRNRWKNGENNFHRISLETQRFSIRNALCNVEVDNFAFCALRLSLSEFEPPTLTVDTLTRHSCDLKCCN